MSEQRTPGDEPASASVFPPCLLVAWQRHEAELLRFLAARLADDATAEDVLQDVFVKALRQGNGFCRIEDARAWLYRVARNALVDHARLTRQQQPLPDDLPANEPELPDPVDHLSRCLPRVLAGMAPADADIVRRCDLEGVTVQAFADRAGLTLPAAKSRLLRARARLREALVRECGVRWDDHGKVCCFTPAER